MSKTEKWAFVDYENVGSLERVKLSDYQKLFVFCGPKNKSIRFDAIPAQGICHIELVSISTGGPDNLDFHLAFHLGKQNELASPTVDFHVISNDRGYDGLLVHLKNLGRACKRVESTPTATQTARTAKRKSVSETSEVEETATTAKPISTARKRSRSTESPPIPEKKPAASSKSVAGKTTVSSKPLSTAARRSLQQLQELDGRIRTRKKDRLLGWLKSHLPSYHLSPVPDPQQVFDEMVNARHVLVDGKSIGYDFSHL